MKPLKTNMSSHKIVLSFLVALCSAHAGLYFLLGISQPVLDMHGFRQSQTALSIYWLADGGPWLFYETPIVGHPWSIPFEFPVYQLFATLLVSAGLPIEVAGRVVSIGFFLGWLWPLRMLFVAINWPILTLWVLCSLLLASPIYVFWARTVMIETCAVFFGLLWLALLVRFMHYPGPLLLAGAMLAGCMCALVKVTSFPGFAVIGGLYVLFQLRVGLLAGELFRRWIEFAGVSAIGLVPIVATLAWTYTADQVKMQNELGEHLTSAALSTWNLGSWDQRWSSAFWWNVVMTRALPDMFGTVGVVFAFTATGIGLASARFRLATAISLVGFLTAFLLFTNLHAAHNYYQAANALFGIAAVAFGISALLDQRRWLLGYGMLIVILGSQFHHFAENFKPAILADQSGTIHLRVAAVVRENTTPNQSLLVFGDDWSSAIPFYSERKALAVPYWAGPIRVRKLLANPQHFLGDRPLGAVVVCPENLKNYGDLADEVLAFAAAREIVADLGWCRVLAPNPSVRR